MDVNIARPQSPLPVARGYALSMTIRSFKGRRDVVVHLFRPEWPDGDDAALDWNDLLGETVPGGGSEESSRKVVLESFTEEERDRIIDYLKAHYSSRLVSIDSAPLSFPVPRGLPALSEVGEGKSVGFIRFEKIPHFDLPFALRGMYDLAQHEPIARG